MSETMDAAGESKQTVRQRAISEAVMTEGAVRIEQLAERFEISLMTVHRDLDELEARGLLRKSRGVATALSSSLVESSDVYRLGRQVEEKVAVATAALAHIEPGQSVFIDDSTTALQLARLLPSKAPITVITNQLTAINELRATRGVTLIALGGTYYNWCSSFMGRMTNESISKLHADVFVMSTAAITGDTCYFQSAETVDTKQAMFEASDVRILLTDHTKFEKRALHALAPLRDFDVVIVDAATSKTDVERLRAGGIRVEIAPA
jgi:DeoR/GlpR family transcriptional regulator of sugar metabolism